MGRLEDLAAFVAVSRHRSFRAAAVERRVSASSLSEAVRDLEAQLGVRLLHRTTRSVAPTEAGHQLIARASPLLAALDDALASAAEGDEVVGRLRINAPVPAIDLALSRVIPGFLAQHPRVEVEVVAEASFVDIVAAGFDAGVRWDESLDQDMVSVPLCGPQRYLTVAAPALLARVGTPEHPKELLDRPCLRQRFPSGREPAWEFERGDEVVHIRPSGPLVSTHGPLLCAMAVAGAGFLQVFDGMLDGDLAAGRLVTVLDAWTSPFPGPRLYYPGRRLVRAPLRAFVAHLRSQVGRAGAMLVT